jgi:mannose-6-phosphate isomerase
MTGQRARTDPSFDSGVQSSEPVRIDKPWGFEELWHVGLYVVKRLHVGAGQRLSLQYHVFKTETLVVQSGRAQITLGDETVAYLPGDVVHIPAGMVHRITADASGDADLFEVSTPELGDVIRLQDDYGRALGRSAPGALQ